MSSSVKLHTWDAPVITKRYYIGLIVFWFIALILPWQWVYHNLSLYSEYINWLRTIPLFSDVRFPEWARFGGLEYSKAQMAFLDTTGVLNVIYVIIRTPRMYFRRPSIWPQVRIILFSALFTALMVWLKWSSQGHLNLPARGGNVSDEVTLVSFCIGYWWLIGVAIAFTMAALLDVWGRISEGP